MTIKIIGYEVTRRYCAKCGKPAQCRISYTEHREEDESRGSEYYVCPDYNGIKGHTIVEEKSPIYGETDEEIATREAAIQKKVDEKFATDLPRMQAWDATTDQEWLLAFQREGRDVDGGKVLSGMDYYSVSEMRDMGYYPKGYPRPSE